MMALKLTASFCLIISASGFIDALPSGYTYINTTRALYKYHKEEVTWGDAASTCRSEGARLFHPDSAEELKLVWERLVVGYIGIIVYRNSGRILEFCFSDVEKPGEYKTVDGRPLSQVYNKWRPGEPTSGWNNQYRCGVFDPFTHTLLYVGGCDRPRPFICKYEALPPVIKEGIEYLVKVDGSEAVLKCRVIGAPKPVVSWVRTQGSERINITGGKYNVTPEGDLVIREVSFADAGTYVCYAKNEVGEDSALGSLTVKTLPPVIKEGPEDLVKVDGSEAVLKCRVIGAPKPVVSWVRTQGSERINITGGKYNVTPEGDLVIREVSFADAGTYVCYAKNEVGEDSASGSLTVKTLPPVIKEGPEDLVKVDGSEAVLKCRVIGAPKPVVSWVRTQGSERINITGGKYNVTPEGDLVIREVSFADAGTYVCYAKNEVGEDSALGSLTVKTLPPVIKEGPEDLVKVDGSEAVLKCRVIGAPKPVVSWVRTQGSERINITGGKYNVTPEGDLVIREVSFADAGTYVCYAKNEVGEDSASGSLTVKTLPPVIKEGPEDLVKVDGSEAVLKCRVIGAPKPVVSWVRTQGSERINITGGKYNVTPEGDLVIREVSFADAGTYVCYAKNEVGEDSASGSLTVKTLPPVIKEGPEDLVKVDGSEAVLKCRVIGAPKPVVSWVRTQGSERINITGGKYNVTPEGDLVIREVSFADAGTYVCYAKNEVGEDSASGSLTVKKSNTEPSSSTVRLEVILPIVIILAVVISVVVRCCWIRLIKKKSQEGLHYDYATSQNIMSHYETRALAAANRRLGEEDFVPSLPPRPRHGEHDYDYPDLPNEHVYDYPDLPNEHVYDYPDLPNEPVYDNADLPNEPVYDNADLPNESVYDNADLPNESVYDNADLPNEPVNDNADLPNSRN